MIDVLRVFFVVQAVHAAIAGTASAQVLFTEDFESDLSGWVVYGVDGVHLRSSGDPAHGQILVLEPNGDVHALILGSESWKGVRFEGQVLFPTATDSYLGFLYNFVTDGDRMDFGNIYLKGNDNYLQVNPHRDYNVSRTLYPEMRADLAGTDAISIGEWTQFRVEVVGKDCHVYIGSMDVPKLVFTDLELDSGALGLQPRSVGGPVWVDNVRVSSIDGFTHEGPSVVYSTDLLLTSWEVLGPLDANLDDAARQPELYQWRPFPTDRRGAVVTGRVVDFHGPKSVAYFRMRVQSALAGQATLHFSTIDDLAIWINGRFHWFLDRGRRAWPDFGTNPDHAGQRIPVDLVQGENEIVIRVRGGVYATGGFLVQIER